MNRQRLITVTCAAVALLLTALKLWLTRAQPFFAIGPAVHDDRLFLELARYLVQGDWLGPYNQLTLAKGPIYPLWVAFVHHLGVPLGLANQLAYTGACALVIVALRPVMPSIVGRCTAYGLLLWNPMTYEGTTLMRILRQGIGVPLVLLVFAGLIGLHLRRTCSLGCQAAWAVLTGLSFAAFWMTREEGVWILPGLGLLTIAYLWSLREEIAKSWRRALAPTGFALLAAAAPQLTVSWLNFRHYDWFGTVEFHATAFKDAYGALVRIRVDPELAQVPVTRQAREAAYAASPTFAELRPFLEGEIGQRWSDTERFDASERQILGGWFVWALRDCVVAAGHGSSAGEAMRFYRRMADEINQACDDGRLASGPRQSGFAPKIDANILKESQEVLARFIGYFLRFDGFHAPVPASIGDHGQLELFRQMTGDRLSPTPTAPLIAPPDQEVAYATRLGWLQRIGANLSTLLRFLAPLSVLFGSVLLVDSIRKRRISYPLLLSVAALLSSLAYLALNALVHVTSFANLTPAALAMAYPLLLLSIVGVGLQAVLFGRAQVGQIGPAGKPVLAWGASRTPAALLASSKTGALFWTAGAVGIVVAFHLREILLHGNAPSMPPWGTGDSASLFGWKASPPGTSVLFPPAEHLPVLPRLVAQLQIMLTGRWDPMVQSMLNAGLFAGGLAFLVRRMVGVMTPWSAFAATALVIGIAGGASARENLAGGTQSEVPLALLCMLWHVYGSIVRPPGSGGWWGAQVAGVAGFFALGGMWIVPLVVPVVSLWTGHWHGSRLRLIPLTTAGAGLILSFALHALAPDRSLETPGALPLSTLLEHFFGRLGWPSGEPGMAVMLNLPLLALACRLRRQPGAPAFDRVILSLGLAIACLIAVDVGAGHDPVAAFVSPWGQLASILSLLNAIALVRVVESAGSWRTALLLGSCAWALTVLSGARELGTADRFHLTPESEPARMELEGLPQQGEDELQGLLPLWPWLAALSCGLFMAGATLQRRGVGDNHPLPRHRLTRNDVWIGAFAGGSALVSMVLLGHPFLIGQEQRLKRQVVPSHALSDLQFDFVGEAILPRERLIGAAGLEPAIVRNLFFGTRPEGPELTCTIVSTRFKLESPWLIVPYAGYPIAHGNGLRVRIEDEDGRQIGDEIGCPGPNPEYIAFWAVDIAAYRGKWARLVLYDGRSDTEAWVAAAPPIPASSPRYAESLARRPSADATTSATMNLGLLIVLSCLWSLATLLKLRKAERAHLSS